MPEKNSAILFDLDGTLLNSGLTFHKIVNQLKRELGQEEVPFKEVKKFSSRGANLILKNCFPDMGSNDLLAIKKSFLENYYEQMLDDICLYEGVPNLINSLQDKNIAWGIVTNKSKEVILSYGVMGGQYQPVGQTHVLQNIFDFNMNVQEAIDYPRAFYLNKKYLLEKSVPLSVFKELQNRGHHTIYSEETHGGGQAIMIKPNNVLVGGSDPRKDGIALGY